MATPRSKTHRSGSHTFRKFRDGDHRQHLGGLEPVRRPKVDVRHFRLLDKLREQRLAPGDYDHRQEWDTGEPG